MTREVKIAKIQQACNAADPELELQKGVMLRHILRTFHVKKLKYRIGAQGYFIDSGSLTATNARWQVLQNDLAKQNDPCIDFLYRVLVADDEDRTEI
ncbi:MAG: hypothetical protein AB7E84_18795 [Xanthobacteraceae bacterium]